MDGTQRLTSRARLLGAALAALALASGALADGWNRVGNLRVNQDVGYTPRMTVERGEDGAEVVTVKFGVYRVWEYRALRKMYTLLQVPGLGFTGRTGQPMVPLWSTVVKAPPGQKLLLEGVDYEWSGKEIHGRWMPNQPPSRDGAAARKLQADPEVYGASGDVLEFDRFSMSEPLKFRGETFVTLNIRPVRYFPDEGRMGMLRSVRIRLRRVGRPHDPPGVERVKKQHPGYMVITPERFRETLRPFLAFKRKTHPDLEVVTLEEIGSSIAEIDAVIEKAGSRGTENFLLVGHSTVLPAEAYDDPFDPDDEPNCQDSDAVYRNRGDERIPSYKVGRFPVVNESELESVVKKTLRRARHPDTYRTHPLIVAHEENAPSKYQGCVTDILESVFPRSKVKLEPRLVLPASKADGGLGSRAGDLFTALRKGTGVFLYRGHGGTDFLASGLLDYFGKDQGHWYEMETAVPPVFFSVACLNGQMTDAEGKRVFGLLENLMTSQSEGVAAGLGAIMPSPTIPNHTFARNLMHYTYVDPQGTLGEVYERAMLDTMRYGFETGGWTRAYLWMADLYNIYGDPEMPMFAPARR